jgi:hypothetical protein
VLNFIESRKLQHGFTVLLDQKERQLKEGEKRPFKQNLSVNQSDSASQHCTWDGPSFNTINE